MALDSGRRDRGLGKRRRETESAGQSDCYFVFVDLKVWAMSHAPHHWDQRCWEEGPTQSSFNYTVSVLQAGKTAPRRDAERSVK